MVNTKKNIKFKKKFKTTIKKNLYKTAILKCGSLGIKSVNTCFLQVNQIESIRRKITRKTQRLFKVKILIKFNLPVTKKSLKTRLGRGSGNIDSWISVVYKGVIILEMFYIKGSLILCLWIFRFLKKNIGIKINVFLREIYII